MKRLLLLIIGMLCIQAVTPLAESDEMDAYLITDVSDYSLFGYNVSLIENPVVYNRNVLTEGNLPLALTSASELNVSLQKQGYPITTEIFILVSEDYQKAIPYFTSKTVLEERTENNKTVYKNVTQTTVNYRYETDYHYVWKPLEKNVPKGTIIVNIKGKWKASIGEKNVDIVPTINNKAFPQYAWWSSSWKRKVNITIDEGYIDETLTNFPVLVTINSTISAYCNSGNSVRFVDSTETTEFYHELDRVWNTTDNNYFWVNVTSIAHDADTVFYMYYSNAAASSSENPVWVWANEYDAVYHFSDNATLVDSAGLGPNGFVNGTISDENPNLVEGKVGNAIKFLSGKCYYDLPLTKLDFGAPYYSDPCNWNIFTWVYGLGAPAAANAFLKYYDAPLEQGVYFSPSYAADGRYNYLLLKTPYTGNQIGYQGLYHWYHLMAWYEKDGGYKRRLMVNNSIDSTMFVGANTTAITNASCYGQGFAGIGLAYNYANCNIRASLDEMRIAIGVNRSVAWRRAEYESINSANFLIVGAEEALLLWTNISSWNISLFNTTTWNPFPVWGEQLFNTSNWAALANWSFRLQGVGVWNLTQRWNISIWNETRQWINVTVIGNGSVGWVNATGVNKPHMAPLSDIITFKAIPFVLCDFDRWVINGVSITSNPYNMTVTGDMTVVCYFSGSTFTWTDNDTDIPSITDVIDPNTGLFNWARIFTISWYYVFGGWFIAIILGIIGGGIWLTHRESPALVTAYFMIILIIYATVTQSIAYILSVVLALVIGFLTYRLVKRKYVSD